MNKRKIILWGPTLLFFGTITAVLLQQTGLFGRSTASLIITNQTSITLSEIIVSLYKEPCAIQQLSPGESSVCSFEIELDSHYKITWKESAAKHYREEVGYVTQGFNFVHKLELLGDGKVNFKIHETS